MSRKTLMKYGVLCAGLAAVAGPASAMTTVDVMVLYDKTLESKRVAPSLRAATMVAYANTALENSKAGHRYRLVHTEAISLPAVTQTDSTALRALTNSPEAAELRKQYGADMVAMITPPKKYCGVGWMGRGSNGTLQSSSKYGHSVVNYYCTSSFGHELGHNLGLGHSPRQNSQGGVYKWGRGHGVDNLFVTMMAYTSAYGAGRLPYFSTPAVHDCKGEPCGVPVN
ncbi:MAG: zinc-dependent metalloprotease family protein, partial [Candidatus Sedimenticola sp. 6PFRAG1]